MLCSPVPLSDSVHWSFNHGTARTSDSGGRLCLCRWAADVDIINPSYGYEHKYRLAALLRAPASFFFLSRSSTAHKQYLVRRSAILHSADMRLLLLTLTLVGSVYANANAFASGGVSYLPLPSEVPVPSQAPLSSAAVAPASSSSAAAGAGGSGPASSSEVANGPGRDALAP